MVGSSPSEDSVLGGCGGVGGGITTSTGRGGGGIAGGSCTAAGGGGGGRFACCVGAGGGGGGAGLAWELGGGGRDPPPEPPGMKEKSSASEDEIHGTCSLREARVTPTLVRFNVSSAIRSGTRISLSNSRTNRLRSPPLSATTEDRAAEYITSVPLGAMTGANPAEKLRNRRSKGLRLEASTSAI